MKHSNLEYSQNASSELFPFNHFLPGVVLGNWTTIKHQPNRKFTTDKLDSSFPTAYEVAACTTVCQCLCWYRHLESSPHKAANSSWIGHVSTQETFGSASDCLVNPSAKPSASNSVGLMLHMGHRLLRSCEDRIQIMRFQRWPEEMGRAPCMCWPRWRRPSVTLCSTSEHSVSLKGTCRGQQNRLLNNWVVWSLWWDVQLSKNWHRNKWSKLLPH